MGKPMKAVRRESATGALYKVTAKSYINGALVGPGEKTDTVYYDGVPGSTLQPMNGAAQKAKQAAVQEEAERKELVRAKDEAALTGQPLALKKVTAPTVHLYGADPVTRAELVSREERDDAARKEADAAAKAAAAASKDGETLRKQQEADAKKQQQK